MRFYLLKNSINFPFFLLFFVVRFQANCKIPSSPYNNAALSAIDVAQPEQHQQQQQNGTTKHSMLDKLKLFNKDKDRSKTHLSKRTSSSSGFSSARSDSSLSLNNDSNIPSPSTAKSGSVSSKKSDISNNTAKTSSSSSKSSTKIATSSSQSLSSKSGKESSLPPPVIKMSKDKKEKRTENGDVKMQKIQSVKFSQQINQQQQPTQNGKHPMMVRRSILSVKIFSIFDYSQLWQLKFLDFLPIANSTTESNNPTCHKHTKTHGSHQRHNKTNWTAERRADNIRNYQNW